MEQMYAKEFFGSDLTFCNDGLKGSVSSVGDMCKVLPFYGLRIADTSKPCRILVLVLHKDLNTPTLSSQA
jgi:hypothetical protein